MYHQPGLPWDRETWDFDGFFVAMPPSLVKGQWNSWVKPWCFLALDWLSTYKTPSTCVLKHLLQVFLRILDLVLWGFLITIYSPDIAELHPFPRIPKIPVAVSTLWRCHEMSWPEMLLILLMLQKSGVPPVEVRSLSHYLQGILYIPGGCFDLWTSNSSSRELYFIIRFQRGLPLPCLPFLPRFQGLQWRQTRAWLFGFKWSIERPQQMAKVFFLLR